MKPWAKAFYLTAPWRHCASAYAKSKGGLCEQCLKRGLIVPGRIVHHKIHLTPNNINDPTVSLNWDNLELLCMDCHAMQHSAKKRYTVDPYGRVTSRE